MNYYTYEHRTAEGHQATVHVGSCESCKNGASILGVGSPENGKWYGPFRSLSAAKSVVPRVNAEVHVCAQLRADPKQQAESFAGQRIEREPDEAVRSNETLARLLRVIEGTGFAGDIRGAPPHIAQPDRPAHLELLKSVATIPAATLTEAILPSYEPTQQMGSYAGQRIEPEPDEAPRRDATLSALLRAIESTDLAEDFRGTSPPIAQPVRPAHSEPPKSIDTIPATTLPVATPTSVAPTQQAESLCATESADLAEDLRGTSPPIAQPVRPAHSEPLKTIATVPAAIPPTTLPVAIPPPAAPMQMAESLRATVSADLAEDLRGAPPPIAQLDRSASSEPPKSIDAIPAATLPLAVPPPAAPTQQTESLRATESTDLAEDLRGTSPPISQPVRPAHSEPPKSIDTIPATTLPVAVPPPAAPTQQAESLGATESMHLVEDFRGAPPPIAQLNKAASSEPPKSIDTIPATTLPVATPTSAAPTQMAESLRAIESTDLAEDLRGTSPPIARPDRPTSPELLNRVDAIPAATLPMAVSPPAAPMQTAESLLATESMDLAEDLRGAPPPIAQLDASSEPLKSIDTIPAATLPVAVSPPAAPMQRAESLLATESMDLAEDLRGAPPPIAQLDASSEPLKSIDTISATTLPVATPMSAAPTQQAESPVVQHIEPLLDDRHAPTPLPQRMSAATERAPDNARPSPSASVEVQSPRTFPRKRQPIWFRNLFSRDPRRSQRLVKPPLVAYYWTGGTPTPHTIADISSSGLFMLTEDLWYPGSILSMTLQRTDQRRGTPESWIAVNLLVIRRTDDGLGAAFVPSMPGTAHTATGREQSCADTKTLERFVKDLTASTEGHY